MTTPVTTNPGSGGHTISFEQTSGADPLLPFTKVHTGPSDADGGPVTATNPFDVRIGDANATASIFPAGFLRTSDEPRQIFYDPFDPVVLDTVNRWSTPVTTNSGLAASIALGSMTLGTGTVANGTSVLLSQPSFVPTVPAWLGYSFAIKLEFPLVINGTRYWGSGTKPTTPAAGAMATEGAGFEVDAAGRMSAVVYAGGTRTLVQDLGTVGGGGNGKQPTDALPHRYSVFYRTDRIYWYIDSLAVPVATSNFQSPNVQTLPVYFAAVAGATPPVSSDNIVCTGLAVWDTGKNSTQISDGTYAWRKATVKAGSAAVATDTGLVVTQSPNRTEAIGTTGALGALNAAATVNAAGYSSVGFFLAAGTLIGTITPEVSYDAGTTWVASQFDSPATGLKTNTIVFASANAATSLSIVGNAGASLYRVRVSAYTSGTANGTLRANDIRDPSVLFTAPPGQLVPSTAVSMAASDGTNLQALRVKAASTTATLTDPALVVAQSPNRAETVGTTTALGALNATATLNAAGYSSVGFFLAAGTLIGTLTPEASYDGGTTWVGATFDSPTTSLKTTTIVFGSANTATSLSIVGSAGASQYRVRVSAFTSGTANGTMRANDIRDPSALFTAPPAQAVPGVVAAMGASDGSLLQALRLSAKGAQAAFGLGTQDLKDSGRTRVSIIFQGAPAVADALLSLVKTSNGVAAGGATTIAVTSGKTLRVKSLTFSVKTTTAVAPFATFSLRCNPTGAAVIGSPSEMRVDVSSTGAAIGASGSVNIPIPDGMEFSGTQQIAVSALSNVTTNVISVTITCFEY
jgi:hypothetical protein